MVAATNISRRSLEGRFNKLINRTLHEEIWRAHQSSKASLLGFVAEKTGTQLSHEKLTLGFARRAAA